MTDATPAIRETIMKDEATPKMIAMARKCAAKYWQTGDPSDEAAARSILSGEWDDQAYTQAALAAIIETQRRDADVADGWLQPDFDESANCMAQNIRDEIRAGHHYGKAEQ